MTALMGILISLGILVVLAVCSVFIVFWVFRSLGLYNMAKERGFNHAWIAWIPFVRNWLVADLIGGKDAQIWGFGGVNWILTFAGLLSFIPHVGWVFGVAYTIYYWFCFNRLYQIYAKDQSTLYTVLSILFGNADAIILFFIRKNPAIFEQTQEVEVVVPPASNVGFVTTPMANPQTVENMVVEHEIVEPTVEEVPKNETVVLVQEEEPKATESADETEE